MIIKKLFISAFLICCFSCSVNLTEGEKVRSVLYNDLPIEVQSAYEIAYRKEAISIETISLDRDVKFEYIKNTGIEIIRPGKRVFKINSRRLYIPWNLNKEIEPFILHDKHLYCIIGDNESWNNRSLSQLRRNRFLKIDLTRYLKY